MMAASVNRTDGEGRMLMRAFGDKPPDSMFSDSLEIFGADWNPDLHRDFHNRRDYDLLPHMPELLSLLPTSEAPPVEFTLRNVTIAGQTAGTVEDTRKWKLNNVHVKTQDGTYVTVKDTERLKLSIDSGIAAPKGQTE